MKRMKKALMLLAGLMVFLGGTPAFAADGVIVIPYAVHAGDWWSGLTLVNMGPNPMVVDIYCSSEKGGMNGSHVGKVHLRGFGTVTKMLPDFFTKIPFPNAAFGLGANPTGRVALDLLVSKGNEDDLMATLFVGNTAPDGGFDSHTFTVENDYF